MKLLTVRRLVLGVSLCVFAALPASLNQPTGSKAIFLVDKVGAHLRWLDPKDFHELSAIETKKNPHDFVISADHKFAYVPIYGAGVYGRNPNPEHEVLIVDLEARKVIGSIDTAPYLAPHGIQIGASGKLYVACDQARKIVVIDPKTRKVERALDAEGTGHWAAILPDESKIYVANKADKLYVTVIDVKSGIVKERIPIPTGTQGITASPDGKTVVTMDLNEPIMTVIDAKTDKVSSRIRLNGQDRAGYKAYYSPDGRWLAVMNMSAQQGTLFDAANLTGPQRNFPTGKDPMGFAFSPDGKTLLVANHGDGTVSAIDLPTLKVIKVFPAGAGIETLTYF